jgi:hypothetical protein
MYLPNINITTQGDGWWILIIRSSFLDDPKNLIDFCSEKVETSRYRTIWTKAISIVNPSPLVILFHDFFIVYTVADIDVCFVGDVDDCGIQVEDIGWFPCRMKMDIETLHECCFSRAYLSYERGGRRWLPAMPTQTITVGVMVMVK